MKKRFIAKQQTCFILPGWSYDIKKWNGFIKEAKIAGINPVVLKIPGLHSKISKPWDVNDYVKWLAEKLQKEKDVILLGHSNGGRIAMSYALKNPNKISKLILIDSAGIYHNELPLRIKRIIFKYLAKTGKKVTNSESLKNLLYKFARENDYNQAPEVMKKTMQNLITHDLTSDLKNIKNEVLIIWGEYDKVTPLSDGKLMSEKMKSSHLEIISKARHSPQFTDTGKVIKLISEFI